MATPRIALPMDEIRAFCAKWQIVEFALFGSVLRDDFRLDSDVDVLVTFAPEAHWGLRFIVMHDELEAILGRPVDLLTRRAVEHSHNSIRRKEILGTAEVVYAAA
jgi:predicted nucleotidyltransferase